MLIKERPDFSCSRVVTADCIDYRLDTAQAARYGTDNPSDATWCKTHPMTMPFSDLTKLIESDLRTPVTIIDCGSSEDPFKYTREGASCVMQAVFWSMISTLNPKDLQTLTKKLDALSALSFMQTRTGLPLVKLAADIKDNGANLSLVTTLIAS